MCVCVGVKVSESNKREGKQNAHIENVSLQKKEYFHCDCFYESPLSFWLLFVGFRGYKSFLFRVSCDEKSRRVAIINESK